ncbi:MAG TPA: hypothetical protein VHA73_15825 [Acidimicrobiales bacterium]|jgi:hypothetical protein|nr:hypothetical protein [Acidimicrobiales bacterium]
MIDHHHDDQEHRAEQLVVERREDHTAVSVHGPVDEVVALELGAVLDEAADAGRGAVHLDLREATLDVMSWVVVERAIGRCRRRGTSVRTTADDSVASRVARRDAQRWLAAVRRHLR